MFGDSFFKRVENKTNVDKNTILSLAKKIQDGNMKDEKTLREVVSEISNLTGREATSCFSFSQPQNKKPLYIL